MKTKTKTTKGRKHPRVQTPMNTPSLTKQSFKDETNINKIMDKFQRTGAINHYAKHAPTYGDATHIELHDALNIVADANSMFEELPSAIRKKFENDPEKFLEFTQDPKNLEEMRELGLAPPRTQQEAETLAAELSDATREGSASPNNEGQSNTNAASAAT